MKSLIRRTRLPGFLMAALLLFGALCAMTVSAQSGGDFEITRSTIDGGGSTDRSPENIFIRGTIGQPDAGATYFGTVYLTGGFWATQGRTGIFFIDGFESGDTSAWTSTVGAASLGGAASFDGASPYGLGFNGAKSPGAPGPGFDHEDSNLHPSPQRNSDRPAHELRSHDE